MNILKTVKGVVTDVTTHWNRPDKDKFVSYKEIMNLGLGGMGQQFATILLGYLALNAGNTLLGSTIGIRPMHLQYMLTIQTILNIICVFIRGKIVDNTRTKWGRFRPYIAIMGFPLVILTSIYIFLPFDTMNYQTKLALTFVFAITIAMVQPVFTDTYGELQTVISPSSEERTKVITINSLILSAAPTLTGLFIPILSNLTGGYTNINTYRYVLVPVALLGVGLNLFTAFGCKERVVTSKTYVQKISAFAGTIMILKNKHWWLRQIAQLIGFMETAVGVVFPWMYIYGSQDMVSYGVATTVLGTASGIAMAITPWMLKKLGNRKLLLLHNSFNVVLMIILLFSYKINFVVLVIFYFNKLVDALALVYNAVMHSEVKDYQQYKCGKRMDFIFGIAGMATLPITMVTGYVIPYVYEYMGLTTNYDILYDPNVRNKLFFVLCIMSLVGAALNLIPFFFYSLSREKHESIIRVLRFRALFEDYESGDFSPQTVKSGVEAIRSGLELANTPAYDINLLKAKLEEAKTTKDKNAIANAKTALADAKLFNLRKESVNIFTDELNKFETPEYLYRVEVARKIVANGANALRNVDISILATAKSLPDATKSERKLRKEEISDAKKFIKSSKLIQKNYPNGIKKPEQAEVDRIYSMPQDTKEQYRARKVAVKEIDAKLDLYYKTVEPFTEAEKLVREYENHFVIVQESEKKYDEACRIITEMEEAEAKKVLEKKADKKLVKSGKEK